MDEFLDILDQQEEDKAKQNANKDPDQMKVAELQEALKERGCTTSGRKAQLVARLKEAQSKEKEKQNDAQEEDEDVLLSDLAIQPSQDPVPPSYLDPILTQKGAKARTQQVSAMRCFDKFLKEYWSTKKPKPENLVQGVKLHTLITEDDLDVTLSGSFCNYLAHADSKNSRDGKLSWATSQAYLGQVKSYFLESNIHDCNAVRLPREKVEECFGKSEYFKRSRSAMKAKISQRAKETGNALVIPKDGGTMSDWQIMAMCCVLHESADLAEFNAITIAMTHFVSRGNETSYVQHHNARCVEYDLPFGSTDVAGVVSVNNFKQSGTAQDMHVYPHAKHWFRCFYFLNAYFFTLSHDAASPYMYPSFAEKALKKDANGEYSGSEIPALWRDRMNKVCGLVEKVKDILLQVLGKDPKFTKGIGSHSAKKCGIQEMGRTLNPIFVIFRAGWTIENAHTLFDYLIRDMFHDIKAAKTCAGWHTKYHDEIWGGYSNHIGDLEPEDRDVFDRFTMELFSCHEHMDEGIRRLYGFSILRFYGDFEEFVKTANYGPILGRDHIFASHIKKALRLANATWADFSKWQVQIKKKFVERNFYGMMLEDLPKKFQVDARPLLEDIASMKRVVQHLTQHLADAQQDLKDLRKSQQATTELLQASQKANTALLTNIQDLLMRNQCSTSPQRTPTSPPRSFEDAFTPPGLKGPEPCTPSPQKLDNPKLPDGVVLPWPHQPILEDFEYSTIIDKQGKGQRHCETFFQLWFKYQLPLLWGRASASEKRSKKNQFSGIKSAVHVMLKHLNQYPAPGDNLTELAKDAATEIKKLYKLSGRPSIQFLKSLVDDYVEDPFPDGTPEVVELYFNERGNNPSGKRRRVEDESNNLSGKRSRVD